MMDSQKIRQEDCWAGRFSGRLHVTIFLSVIFLSKNLRKDRREEPRKTRNTRKRVSLHGLWSNSEIRIPKSEFQNRSCRKSPELRQERFWNSDFGIRISEFDHNP